jgi:hypothetical protein
MSRKSNRKINRARVTTTAEGCTVTTEGNHITLESPKATVTDIRSAKPNREWLDRATRSVAAYEVLA